MGYIYLLKENYFTTDSKNKANYKLNIKGIVKTM